MHKDTQPEPVISPMLADSTKAGIRHGFFTRKGGVSEGIYQGLNTGLGSNDELERVVENRARVSRWFDADPGRLETVHQIHSNIAVTVSEPLNGHRPEADALVTAVPGLVLGILTADCGPVLFCDPVNRVVGAAHAGWKGALYGVLESTIEAMEALGAERKHIKASLGPSISGRNYEVGPEFVDRFVTHDPAYGRYFSASTKPGHAMFDLQGLTLMRLEKAGIEAECLGICTYEDEDGYFSYRRTTHRGEPDYGRQISAIAIMEA